MKRLRGKCIETESRWAVARDEGRDHWNWPSTKIGFPFGVMEMLWNWIAQRLCRRVEGTKILWSVWFKMAHFLWFNFCELYLKKSKNTLSSVQFSSVTQSCPTLCDPMNCSTPGLPVHHQLPEFTQTHIHRVHDAIQPSHPLSPPSSPAPNPSQHQSLFQWVNSSHEVAKVLEFQL